MGSTAMTGLSADVIGELLAKTRTRNAYGPKLVEFMESDEAAINPAEVWPEFKDKQSSTLYQGFMLAAKKAGIQDELLIKQHDESVFILHKERVTLALAAQTDED